MIGPCPFLSYGKVYEFSSSNSKLICGVPGIFSCSSGCIRQFKYKKTPALFALQKGRGSKSEHKSVYGTLYSSPRVTTFFHERLTPSASSGTPPSIAGSYPSTITCAGIRRSLPGVRLLVRSSKMYSQSGFRAPLIKRLLSVRLTACYFFLSLLFWSHTPKSGCSLLLPNPFVMPGTITL